MMESTVKNMHEMKVKSSAVPTEPTVNKMTESKTRTEFKRRHRHQRRPGNSTYRLNESAKHSETPSSSQTKCYRCGNPTHKANNCMHKTTACSYCNKMGHLARVCISAARSSSTTNRRQPNNNLHEIQTIERDALVDGSHYVPDSGNEYCLFSLSSLDPAPGPYLQDVAINGKNLTMEVDTGAAYTLISLRTFRKLLGHNPPQLRPSTVSLRTYQGQNVHVMGQTNVTVTCNGLSKNLLLLVVSHDGTSLIGRNWLRELSISFFATNRVNSVSMEPNLKTILANHAILFSPGLGLIKDTEVHLHQKPNVLPAFYRPRSVPFAYRDKIHKELDRLLDLGIIEPVKTSSWAAPIVPILKQDGSIRICGDFKLTANTATDTERYPLPKISELFANLNGGKKFTKLDLRDAYNQLLLDKESRKLVVINTHRGLFRYTRLPFGVSSASAAFQRQIELILQGITGIAIFQDDLLLTGKNDEEHLYKLNEVLSRLEAAGARLRKDKCRFMVDSVDYLGHRIDSHGLHPSESKVEPILKAPTPTNQQELRSFLGLITYYAKFIPNMATFLSPLYKLTQATTDWVWNRETEDAFQWVKSVLSSSTVLVHYDLHKPVTLACDASPTGLGAVLSHVQSDGSDRPISYASRTLTKAEINYSQIEKEALAVVFGVSKFREYILGRHFILLTDHNPLTVLLSPKKHVPTTTAARIQRWAVTLGAYDYEIQYRPGRRHGNADALSRSPIPHLITDTLQPQEYVLAIQQMDTGPVTASELRSASKADPVAAKLLDYIINGWPRTVTYPMAQFTHKRSELSVNSGIIFWNNRVFIPQLYRSTILKELHFGHFGIVKTKRLARASVWWPAIDQDIERMVASCSKCQEVASMPNKQSVQWPKTHRSMQRVHVDYLGPFENKMIFIFLDSYSNWIEAVPTMSITSKRSIDLLTDIFSRYGLPECLVSDNGTTFTSSEFSSFMQSNGIKHLTIAPYHPASNGHAEKAVGTVKKGLQRERDGSISTRLSRILFAHRRIPNDEGLSPADLFLQRPLRSRLDLLRMRPRITETLPGRQPNQQFRTDDTVWVKNYGKGPKWHKALVLGPVGNAMLSVSTPFGVKRTHINQTRHRSQFPLADEFTLPHGLPPRLLTDASPPRSHSGIATQRTLPGSDSTVRGATISPATANASSTTGSGAGVAHVCTSSANSNRRSSTRTKRPPCRLEYRD